MTTHEGVRPVGTEFLTRRCDGGVIIITHWRVTGATRVTPRGGGDDHIVETVEMVSAPRYERVKEMGR